MIKKCEICGEKVDTGIFVTCPSCGQFVTSEVTEDDFEQ